MLIEPFGDPATGPSSWHLSMHSDLLLDAPLLGGTWIRISRGTGAPASCVAEEPAVLAEVGAGSPAAPELWMEQVRVLELRDAPVDSVVTLWAECADAATGTGIDSRSGWVITVL